jgi:hypothetical protein
MDRRRLAGKRAAMPSRILAAPCNPWDWDRTTHGQADGGKEDGRKTGTETPPGTKKQFLTSMDPEIIRRIKSAAALRDKTASVVLEEAAKEWLERHLDGKK